MKLNDFIATEKPWAYNFEFECEDEKYKKLDTFTRYFIYKTQPDPPAFDLENTAEFIKSNFGYHPVYDPDGSDQNAYYPIVIEIYKHLWNWNCPAEPEQREYKYAEVDGDIFGECVFGPDTMNSVQSPLKEVDQEKYYSIYRTIHEYYNPDGNEININGLADYIDWYHTLGNLVLVPAGFNEYRGKSKTIKDFWDLSLDDLKKNGYNRPVNDYNYEKHRRIVRPVVFEEREFNKYINYFFLWDSVEYKDNDYIVRSISHKDWDQDSFLPTFFVKTREIIERRGRFMTAMLIIEQNNPVLYKEIQEWIVAKNGNGELPFFYGMNDAVWKILEKFGEKIPENAKGILRKLEGILTYGNDYGEGLI